MPRYEAQLGRARCVYEHAYVIVDADDEHHAKALALEIDQDDMDWHRYDGELFDEVRVEASKEVKE